LARRPDGDGVRGGGAELGEFVAVGVGLGLGALGAGAQVGAQLLTLAGGVSVGLTEHPAGVGTDPLGLGLGGVRGGLSTRDLLPRLPGGGLGVRCRLPGLGAVGLGGLGAGVGFGAGLSDGGVPFGLGFGDPRLRVRSGLGHGGVAVGFGGLGTLLGGAGAVLGGGQFLADLLDGGIRIGPELVGFGGTALGLRRLGLGGRGALLGGGTDRLHLGLGGGRVGQDIDPVPRVGAERGDPVGFGAQRAQQFRAGHLGHGHRAGVVGRADHGAVLLGGQAAAFPPRRYADVAAPGAVLWRTAGILGRGGGLPASRVLARRSCRGAGSGGLL
jgi:hypothetical protein